MVVRDGRWRLWDHDVKLGRTVWVTEDDQGNHVFRTDYRVDPTIDENTAVRNMATPGWAGDYHRVASIPLNVFHDQLAEASRQQDDKFISNWLNDSDNAAWRTKEGRV